jgi:hypothetical protein
MDYSFGKAPFASRDETRNREFAPIVTPESRRLLTVTGSGYEDSRKPPNRIFARIQPKVI